VKNVTIIMGGPGSGKGTISGLLMRSRDFNYIETGAMFRSMSGDPEVAEIMRRGGLVPDEKLFAMIKREAHGPRDILLDGFPRNVAQAKWLLENFRECRVVAVYLNIPKPVMFERIRKRFSEGSSRADDVDEATITNRVKTFETGTLQAIQFLRGMPEVTFIEINAMLSPDEISAMLSPPDAAE
jgi:adenylate kinase family enzyme